MISEPKNFEHLIHTETEEEATIIFKEWMRNPSAGKLPGEHYLLFGFAWKRKEKEKKIIVLMRPVHVRPSLRFEFRPKSPSSSSIW